MADEVAGLAISVVHRIPNREPVTLAWSPDGERLAALGSDGLHVFAASTGDELEHHSRTTDFDGVAWSPDGNTLAVGGVEPGLFSQGTFIPFRDRLGREHGYIFPYVAFTADGGSIVIGGALAPAIRIDDPLGDSPGVSFGSRGISAVCIGSEDRLVLSRESRIIVVDTRTFRVLDEADMEGDTIGTLAASRDGRYLAAAIGSAAVICDSSYTTALIRLEGHVASEVTVAFSPSGDLLATAGTDGLKVWSTDSWLAVGSLDVPHQTMRPAVTVAFSPVDDRMLAMSTADGDIAFCRLSLRATATTPPAQRQYATARVALVGDSMVGKTHLGHRIAKGDWRAYPSTHGQEFWVVDDLGATRSDGVECEAVLWDFAGQDDYKLVHALFLDDIDVALLLFDPSDRRNELASVEFWRRQLRTAEESGCEKVLVGTKIDRGHPAMTEDEIADYCEQHGFAGGYVATSALEGTGVDVLKARIVKLIDWASRPATITTEVFKRIKELVLAVKESASGSEVLVTREQLRARLAAVDSSFVFSDDELREGVKHLANHGYVSVLTTASGDTEVLLSPETMVKLASSIVLAARANSRGLGSLEEASVLAREHHFPEIADLDAIQQQTLLDGVTALFLRANICFRASYGQRVFLVFPSLIHQRTPTAGGDIVFRDSVSYTVTGAVTQVFPALVVLLGYTEQFLRHDHWQNQARYELGPGEVCGFRLVQEHQGEIHLVLNAAEDTPPATTMLFEGLVERFLIQRRGITIRKYPAIDCGACGARQDRTRVVKALDATKAALRCDDCDTLVSLPAGAAEVGVHRPDSAAVDRGEARALRRTRYETALVSIKRLANDVAPSRGERPTSYISYAWGDVAEERWVEALATDLVGAGVEVLLDRWHNPPGGSITRFIDDIDTCSCVLVIGTPGLREKYDRPNDDSTVGAELRLIGRLLRRDRSSREAVVPLLRSGDAQVFPPQLQDQVHVDFRDDAAYFDKLVDLLLSLYGIPFHHPGAIEVRRQMELGPNEAKRLIS